MPLIRNSNLRNPKRLWRVLGFMSSFIGLVCYAMSSSFKHLFGEWNSLKVVAYAVVSIGISSMMLFLKRWNLSRSFLQKAHAGVLVLILTSLYSFFSDKAVSGKPDLLSLISCASFAFMSLSLSRQIELGFEADLLNFFLGCLTVQLMKINLLLSIVAAVFCYSLMILRSKLLESRPRVGTLRMQDHVAVEIDTANVVDDYTSVFQSSYSSSNQQMDDGYGWRKYEEKNLKRRGNQRSYYRCTHKNCSVKKKVVRSVDGQIIDIIYKGTHAHCKRDFTIKRNSSSESFYSLLPLEPFSTDFSDQSFASIGSGELDHDATPESSSLSI